MTTPITTPQIAALVAAAVSAVLAAFGIVDPGGVLARPDVQAAIVGIFAAGVPLFFALWTYFHHTTAPVAQPPSTPPTQVPPGAS